MTTQAWKMALCAAALALVTGCQGGLDGISTAALEAGDGRKAEGLAAGKYHFRAANYGLAERNFRKAVGENPLSAEAWLGLAAAYDQLGRFDLADRAYGQLQAITGPAPQVLNNLGYSHLLRGDTGKARAYLARARQAMPDDATVRTNMALLGAL